MKVLFLDFDGVLNNHLRWPSGYNKLRFENVVAFNEILRRVPDLKIVISSAWRYMVLNGAMTLKGFEYLLLVGGVDCKDRVIGITCSDEEIERRSDQIRDYLNKNQEITKYVILDDMDFGFRRSGLRYVQTYSKDGLQPCQVNEIIRELLK